MKKIRSVKVNETQTQPTHILHPLLRHSDRKTFKFAKKYVYYKTNFKNYLKTLQHIKCKVKTYSY